MIPIVRADGAAEWELLASLRRRSGEVDRKVTAAVTEIIDAVRERGDDAVREYTVKFDGCAGFPASGSTCRAARRPTPRRCS